MKILLSISSLKAGGAERVLSHLANYWVNNGKDISIVTTWSAEKDFYALDPKIRRMSLNRGGESASMLKAALNNLNKAKTLYSYAKAENPDVIISFLPDSNILSILVACILKKKVIVSERNNATKQSMSLSWRALRRLTYPFAHAAVFVSRGVERDFNWLSQKKRFVINNPALNKVGNIYADGPKKLQILSIGRLTSQKGHDLLIDAFAEIAHEFPDWNILIAGEGPDRQKLEERVKQKKLAGRIAFYGVHNNPQILMHESSLFVLSSRYEGFPNALVESMAAGMAVISFDCPYGPSDIIEDGKNGILVPPEDVDRMAVAMKSLMSDAQKRQSLGASATDISRRLGIDTIAAQWETVIREP